jgi:LmbE family N-acetylglucosaminyl deacetylase
VVAVGAHPDDAESGCGGTLARYSEAGHAVTIIYLTRGELGIERQAPEETAKVRTAEALEACKILGARAVFAGQVNGHVEVTPARADALAEILARAAPDVVFAPWPVDVDGEHQVASILTLRAHLATKKDARLFFYEIDTGTDTLGFDPSLFVDISAVRQKKIDALRAHESQSFTNLYERHARKIEELRGRQIGVSAAEAFVPHAGAFGLPPF